MAIDVDFDKRVLLLHFDGSNGSTTITDSSKHGHTCTVIGNAQITTSQSVFGGASVEFDGNGDGISVPYSAELSLEGVDWCVEGRARSLTSSGDRSLVDFRGTGADTVSMAIYVEEANRKLRLYDGSGSPVFTSDNILPTANNWYSWAVTRSGNVTRIFIDGVKRAEHIGMTVLATHSTGLRIGLGNGSNVNPWSGQHDELRITKGAAVYTADYTPSANAFSDERGGWVQIDGPLGQPALFGLLDVTGHVLNAGPLGQPQLLGWSLYALAQNSSPLGQPSIFGRIVFGRVEAPSMLADPSMLGFHDFTSQLDITARVTYVMDLVTPSGLVRVPISSWQSTLTASEASYTQCVIPAVTSWVSTIETATSFILSRRTTLSTGTAYEYAMTTAPTQNITFDQGGRNHTATISGYTAAYPAAAVPSPSLDRTLQGVRLLSLNNGRHRVQCAVDWLLRPGQRAVLDGDPFVVEYINYFCNTDSESMIVGEAEA